MSLISKVFYKVILFRLPQKFKHLGAKCSLKLAEPALKIEFFAQNIVYILFSPIQRSSYYYLLYSAKYVVLKIFGFQHNCLCVFVICGLVPSDILAVRMPKWLRILCQHFFEF